MSGKLALQATSMVARDGEKYDYFRPVQDGGQILTQTGASVKVSTAISTGLVTLYTDGDCYVNVGGSSVTASNNDLFVAATERITIALKGATHVASLGTTGDKVYISELE